MTTPDPAPSGDRIPTGPVLGLVITVATILLLGTLVPANDSNRGLEALILIASRGWPALLWLAAAIALGDGFLTLLGSSKDANGFGLGIRGGIGAAILIILDTSLAGLHLLGRGDEAIAWSLLALPAGILLARSLRNLPSQRTNRPPRASGLGPITLAWAIPIGVLLLAAVSTPGWLWGTEFGGYDALSYHLQLPREWWYAGGLIETPHNAYGYLPGGVSAAFLHLMTLSGDPAQAAISCQILMVGITVLAALATGDLARTLVEAGTPSPSRDRSRLAGSLAGLALLSTPWVVVVGSLAYDEGMVILFAAASASIIMSADRSPSSRPANLRIGALLGVLLGAAMLAKASSGVLVILPLAAVATVTIPRNRWWLIATTTAGVGMIACLPWLLRNAGWTGNPFFPFATGLFGQGPWTSEQAARFAAAHGAADPLTNLLGLGREFLLDDLLGGLPEGEPVRPQWWWLPAVGIGATFVLVLGPRTSRSTSRRLATGLLVGIVVTLLAWMFATHGKARFLLPVAPLLAVATGIVMTRFLEPGALRIPVIAIAWCAALGPGVMYATERNGDPSWGVAADEAFDGSLEARLMADADRRTALERRRNASPAFVLEDLGPDAKTLLIGIANPFHLPIEDRFGEARRFQYTTVWTRGPIEDSFARDSDASPEEAARNAIAELRKSGFTHLLISPTMLEIWSDSGWLDPDLEPSRITALPGAASVRVVHVFPDGGTLLEIGDTSTP